tara:strand:- start:704 stop:985 length:282 start_codon:yes stop_codon:yes gene_type:complete
MKEGVKFSDEEMKDLKLIQDTYIEVQNQFGQIAFSKLSLQSQAQELNKLEEEYKEKFIENKKRENELVSKLTQKYGDGTLDPKTGIFTPVDSE